MYVHVFLKFTTVYDACVLIQIFFILHTVNELMFLVWPFKTSLTSAVWRRCTPAAIRQTGDLLRSIQQEVLFTEVVDVKAGFIFNLLDSHHVAMLHLSGRLAVHR